MFLLTLKYLGVMICGVIVFGTFAGTCYGIAYVINKAGVSEGATTIITFIIMTILISFGFACLDTHIKNKQDRIINGDK